MHFFVNRSLFSTVLAVKRFFYISTFFCCYCIFEISYRLRISIIFKTAFWFDFCNGKYLKMYKEKNLMEIFRYIKKVSECIGKYSEWIWIQWQVFCIHLDAMADILFCFISVHLKNIRDVFGYNWKYSKVVSIFNYCGMFQVQGCNLRHIIDWKVFIPVI